MDLSIETCMSAVSMCTACGMGTSKKNINKIVKGQNYNY